MKKLIILLFVIAGCNSEDPTEQIKFEIAPEFIAGVESFYSEAQEHGITVPDTDNLIISVLSPNYQDENGVFANSRYYKKNGQRIIEISEIEPCTEMPLFRELAHVLLSMPYTAEGEVIMNRYADPCAYVHTPTGEFYTEIRDSYLQTLFE